MTDPRQRAPLALSWAKCALRARGCRLFALLLGLGLAIVAQRRIDERVAVPGAVAAYLVGALLFGLASRRASTERSSVTVSSNVRGAYLRWALVFAGLTFFAPGVDRFTLQPVLSWLLAMGTCYLALSVGDRVPTVKPLGSASELWARFPTRAWTLSWPTVGLAVALVVGAFFRFHRLYQLPADLGWDLPYNYTDALRVLEGEYPVFFTDNYGREGLFFYLIAGVSKLVGLSPYGIRITSALVGMAAIPAIYLLGVEASDRETGVYAALLLSVNRWHLVLTRSGYRVSLMPLLTILSLYGLARALRRGAGRDWALTGLFVGLGLWSYRAFLFVPPIMLLVVLVYSLKSRLYVALRWADASSGDKRVWPISLRPALKGFGLMLLMATIVTLPMVRFVLESPEAYLARGALGSQLIESALGEQGSSRVQLYGSSLATSLLMFNYQGDGNSRFGVPFQRHLGWLSGALFILGLATLLVRWSFGMNTLLLLSVLGLMLPMTVTMLPGESPNCFRSSGEIGPVLAIVAIALTQLRRQMTSISTRRRDRGGRDAGARLPGRARASLALLLVAGILTIEGRESSRAYFRDFSAVAPDVANYSVALQMADILIDFEDGPGFVVAWPHWYDGRAIGAHLDAAGAGPLTELSGPLGDRTSFRDLRGTGLVLVHPDDGQSLRALQAIFFRWSTRIDRYPTGDPAIVVFCGQK